MFHVSFHYFMMASIMMRVGWGKSLTICRLLPDHPIYCQSSEMQHYLVDSLTLQQCWYSAVIAYDYYNSDSVTLSAFDLFMFLLIHKFIYCIGVLFHLFDG